MTALMKTVGTNDCGCCECVDFQDAFNRANEDYSAIDSTGNWSGHPEDGAVGIVSNEISFNFPTGTTPPMLEYLAVPPDDWGIDLKFAVPTDGIFEVAVVTSTSQELAVRITESSGCGIMRLYHGSGPIGIDNYIPEFDADVKHRLKLCYDSATQRLSVVLFLEEDTSNDNSAHAVPVTFTGTFDHIEIRAVLSAGLGHGVYTMDDFKLLELKNEENNCPCCRLNTCSLKTDAFEDASIACWWSQDSGSWTEYTGYIETTSSNAVLLWRQSWFGVNGQCETDDSTMIQVSVENSAYDSDLLVIFDRLDASHYHYARVKLASTMGATDGTLKIFSSVSGELGSVTIPELQPDTGILWNVCFGGGLARTSIDIGGINVGSVEVEIGERFGGQAAALGTGMTGGSTTQFSLWTISHDIFNSNCPDCFAGEAEEPCEPPCIDGRWPKYARVSISGLGPIPVFVFPPGADFYDQCCLFMNGSFILTQDASPPPSCILVDPGDLHGPVTASGCCWTWTAPEQPIQDPQIPCDSTHSCDCSEWGLAACIQLSLDETQWRLAIVICSPGGNARYVSPWQDVPEGGLDCLQSLGSPGFTFDDCNTKGAPHDPAEECNLCYFDLANVTFSTVM